MSWFGGTEKDSEQFVNWSRTIPDIIIGTKYPLYHKIRKLQQYLNEIHYMWAIIVHTYNPSTWETEAGGLWICDQPEPQSKTLSTHLPYILFHRQFVLSSVTT